MRAADRALSGDYRAAFSKGLRIKLAIFSDFNNDHQHHAIGAGQGSVRGLRSPEWLQIRQAAFTLLAKRLESTLVWLKTTVTAKATIGWQGHAGGPAYGCCTAFVEPKSKSTSAIKRLLQLISRLPAVQAE